MQRNVEDVILAWESGREIETIALESDGNSQEDLHRLAFSMVKAAKNAVQNVQNIAEFRMAVREIVKDANVTFSEREIISAESLAFLTMKHGWSRALKHHNLISLRNPATASAR